MRISFQVKLFLFQAIVFSVLFSFLGFYYYNEISQQLYYEIGQRAKLQAEEIAASPVLRKAVSESNIIAISEFMQQRAPHSDASFLVIGNSQGIHLYHSADSKALGKKLVGDDNESVLKGVSSTTIRKGRLGISLRSKAPVFDDNNNVTGIVSVGYLKKHLYSITLRKSINILIGAILLLLSLFIFSWFFSRGIKKQIFSLEPREIGLLVRQQKAIMESIYEGVIAIDSELRIEVINQAARRLLGLNHSTGALKGHSIEEFIFPVSFFDRQRILEKDTHDEICHFNQLTVIASRVRIMLENRLQGWVITFRDRNEIDSLNAQLSQVNRYVDNLRIMRHEQLNRMSTLSGLLHMQRYDEAVRFVKAESDYTQELLDFISSRFSSPVLCGLLLGKAARAHEKGVELLFDPLCLMARPCSLMSETELLTITGNLLDNAIEATQRATLPHYPVEVLILLNERELIIEVADRGVGIDADIREKIFDRGITTKNGGDHGIGLYLIASYVAQVNGSIEISANTPRGTIFSVFIPEERETEQVEPTLGN